MTETRRTILIVEDEPQIRRFLIYALEAAGYLPVEAANGAEAMEKLRHEPPDLMILDLGLPDIDGKEVIRGALALRALPIIVLSAHDAETERIAALDLGACDFIPKPFGIGEMLARLRAHLRPRLGGAAPSAAPDRPADWGALRIDPVLREVTLGGEPVKLTRKEFDLAWLLAQNEGRIMTHKSLLERVWGPAHAQDLPYLRVFIGQLRRKLTPDREGPLQIRTESGIGYRWAYDPIAEGET